MADIESLVEDIADEDILTVQEAADALRIDTKWFYELLKQNDLPHFRLGPTNGRIRLWKKPFYVWLLARTHYGSHSRKGGSVGAV